MRERGYYGEFGGAYIPEILVDTFDELESAFEDARKDPSFWREYTQMLSRYSCRPTPITYAENLTRYFGGASIYVKREDLNHTGAHKANNVLGQGLLAKRMGKKRVIAETGAGQHGVATATMQACFDLAAQLAAELPIPFVFMGYYNSVWKRGIARFARETRAAGLHGHREPDGLRRRHRTPGTLPQGDQPPARRRLRRAKPRGRGDHRWPRRHRRGRLGDDPRDRRDPRVHSRIAVATEGKAAPMRTLILRNTYTKALEPFAPLEKPSLPRCC